ncbi:hypothetical protein Salat_2736300 [Sesamum alatum]|uniref:Uncharacterized protein n=1 Tax=Sesamum alatum TaxID=300844 RepID=A0AAE2C8S4_9LAMI|nr:hypothetical protein Salat_2736300 [Sesamum alatum]
MRVLHFLCMQPVKIMKCGVSLLNLEPSAAAGTTPRRRPLHTCGAAFLAIAHKAIIRVQDLDGPLGSTAKRAITFLNSFFPFVYSMLYHWLALLSIMDDHILTVESMVEVVFPPSKRLFDKIDGLVCSAEVLPEQLDDILRKFPLMVHQFPFLDWVLVRLISWLNFLLSILTHWGSKNTSVKEITVDDHCTGTHGCRSEPEIKTAYSPVKSSATQQPDSLEGKANAARNHIEPSNTVQSSVQEKANAAGNQKEDTSIAIPEDIRRSIKRLHSLRNRPKSLEEPHCAADSPMYSTYKSANSSPVSDSPQGESSPFSQMAKPDWSYKEMLKKGKKDEDGEGKDDKTPAAESPAAFAKEEKAEIAEKDGK